MSFNEEYLKVVKLSKLVCGLEDAHKIAKAEIELKTAKGEKVDDLDLRSIKLIDKLLSDQSRCLSFMIDMGLSLY